MQEFHDLHKRTYRLRVFDVKFSMKHFELTPTSLAKKIDVSTRSINKWLKGEPLFLKNVISIAKALGESPQSIIEGMEPCASRQMEKASTRPALSVAMNIDCATPEEFMYLCELLGEVKEKFQAFKESKEPRFRVYYLFTNPLMLSGCQGEDKTWQPGLGCAF